MKVLSNAADDLSFSHINTKHLQMFYSVKATTEASSPWCFTLHSAHMQTSNNLTALVIQQI